ncbi:hypothetical protein [Fodinicurvata fenggangensis]|uniref:hypothetical protein n=1 Tax=Fodinicurvata fenggangensis TaxID=1121830 RepID=UPI00047D7D79|nr:hypothetical protein [Fodinicurvata fenggangensis]
MPGDREDWCLWCGADLPEDRPWKKIYCSRECSQACNNRIATERRRAARLTPQNCPWCKASLPPDRYIHQIYCSRKCRHAHGARIRSKHYHENVLTPRPCVACGKTFKPMRKDKVACSKTCQKAHWLAQQGPDYDEKELEAKRASVAAKRAAQPPKPCAWCGTPFKPEGRKGRKEMWCSNSCRAKAWRDRIKVPPETRTCAHCSAGFEVKPNSKRRFCSQACGRQANRLPRTPSRCEHCGWTFTPRRLRRERTLRFCSRECAWKGLRGKKAG